MPRSGFDGSYVVFLLSHYTSVEDISVKLFINHPIIILNVYLIILNDIASVVISKFLSGPYNLLFLCSAVIDC